MSDRFLICYQRFQDGHQQDVYIFPSTVWNNPSPLFVDYLYDKPGQKSKPEYGINYNKKNPFSELCTTQKQVIIALTVCETVK